MTRAIAFRGSGGGRPLDQPGRTITETDIVNFAGMTGDYDPLHVDHEFARQTPFGKPIAHGLLGLSLVAGLASQCPSVRTIAFLKIESWEFLKPIYIGDTVHAETEVIAKNRQWSAHRLRVTWRRQLINQAGDVVQAGVFQTLVADRESSPQVGRRSPRRPPAALGRQHASRGRRSCCRLTAPVTVSRAACSVLRSSIAIVMGPTPPGTGVMCPATCLTCSIVDVAHQTRCLCG